MRILLKREIGMGDVIWTTPVLRALKQINGRCELHVATAYADLFVGNPWVDAVLASDCNGAGYDRVIDLNGAYERRRHLHVLAAYAEEAGVAVADTRPEINLALSDYEPVENAIAAARWAALGVDRIIAVHMAATSPDRIWPPRHWQSFLLRLLERPDLGVIVVGHNADFAMKTSALEERMRGRIIGLVGRCTIRQTAAALAVSDLLVAPDSGLSHLAAAVGTRAVVLYGMTEPRKYLPLHGSAEGVWTSVDCRGCIVDVPAADPPLCRRGKAVCYDAIDPAAVLAACDRALATLRGAPGWPQRLDLVSTSAPGAAGGPASNRSAEGRKAEVTLRSARARRVRPDRGRPGVA